MDFNEEVAKVAYELYEKSGRIDGRDVENWIEAEKIVKSRQASDDLVSTVKQIEEKVGVAVEETIHGLTAITKKAIKKAKSIL